MWSQKTPPRTLSAAFRFTSAAFGLLSDAPERELESPTTEASEGGNDLSVQESSHPPTEADGMA